MNTSLTNLPVKFLERIEKIIPVEKKEQIFTAFTTRRPSTFRANILKISAEKLEEKLQNLGIQTKKVAWYKDAFILKNVPQKTLMETDLYKQGYLYIQGLSSMLPPLILNPRQGDKILDIAAAPGSKTTQIAALMKNTGEILANDKSHVRNYKLKANLQLQGVANTQVTQLPGQIIWKKLPNYFDKALVDVPCSMEGRFYTEDSKTYQDWTTKKIKLLEEQQKYLLRSAISSVRPGGIIVYSTCTLSPEENEGVIDWILKKEQDTIEIEEISLPGLPIDQPVMKWNTKQYNSQVQKTIRILPSPLMEGFYVAKIKKLK